MATHEETTIKLLCRLFWLVTQTPGVARYVSDVELFCNAELEVTDDIVKRESLIKLRDGYLKEKQK